MKSLILRVVVVAFMYNLVQSGKVHSMHKVRCKVPWIKNGQIKEETRVWDWHSSSYITKYNKVYPGSMEPFDSDLYVFCNTGYSVNGTGLKWKMLKCSQRKWSAYTCLPDLKIQCSLLDEAGIFDVAYSDGQTVNSTASFSCKDGGQRIEGSSTRRCGPDGTWSGAYPACVDRIVECEPFDERGIFNIDYSDGQSVNSTASFSCKDGGQQIEGSSTRRCGPDGTWSGVYPACIDRIVECQPFDEKDVFNVDYSNGQTVNSTAFFSCKDGGQRIEGSSTRRCGPDGTWSGVYPACVDWIIECEPFDERGIFNVDYSDGQMINSTAFFSCKDEGQQIEGSSTRRCGPAGIWSGVYPACVDRIIECQPFDESGIFNVDYSDGQSVDSTASFSCKNGGQRIEGSSTRRCGPDGTWSGVYPACIESVSQCPLFDEDGIFDVVYSNGQAVDSIASFSCKDESQWFEGSSTRTCGPDGRWSGASPVCIERVSHCPLFDEDGIFHIVYSDEQREDSTASFSCKDENQQIEGVRTRMCGSDGRWSGTNPECIERVSHCPLFDDKGIFDVIYSNGQTLDSTASFSCKDESHRIEGSQIRICESDGRWSGTNPVCIERVSQCPLFENESIFDVVYSNGQTVDSSASFSCKDESHRIEGSRVRTCEADGQWSGTNPVCIERVSQCPLFDEDGIFDVVYSDDQMLHSIASFSCKEEGQRIEGMRTRICEPDGRWSETNPVCIERVSLCPLFDEDGIFVIVYSDGQTAGSTASFSCKDESQWMEGSRTRTCGPDGRWSGMNPVCIEHVSQCPKFDEEGIFDIVYSDGQNINSTVSFSCKDESQRFDGSRIRTCGADGRWSGTDPVCIIRRIQCPLIDDKGIFHITYSDEQNVNSIAKFTCKADNQDIKGADERICQKDGQWSSGNPVCAERCKIPQIENGYMKKIMPPWALSSSEEHLIYLHPGSMVLSSSKLLLYCKEGYSISRKDVRHATVTCLDGKLSPKYKCLLDHCKIPWIKNGEVLEKRKEWNWDESDYDVKLISLHPGSIPSESAEIFLHCDSGYSAKGKKMVKLICLQNKWSYIPACLPK